jgi:hypothetical protein
MIRVLFILMLSAGLAFAQEAAPAAPADAEDGPVLEGAPEPDTAQPAAPAPAPGTPAAPATPSAPATPVEAAPKPAPKPAAPPKPSTPPAKGGIQEGKVWEGQRIVVDRYAGWGWVWPEGKSPSNGRWVLFRETPGRSVAPHRYIANREGDANWRYKLYGDIAPYKGYEPAQDVMVDVFVLNGFETIGPADPLKVKIPQSSRSSATRSSMSSRDTGRKIKRD